MCPSPQPQGWLSQFSAPRPDSGLPQAGQSILHQLHALPSGEGENSLPGISHVLRAAMTPCSALL